VRFNVDQHCVFYERYGIMEGLKAYLFSVVAAAIVCALLKALIPGKSSHAEIIKLLSGLFLAITVIAPLAKLEFGGITDYMDDLTAEGQSLAQAGESMAREEAGLQIKNRIEAYILDKANSLKLDMTVEVVLNEQGDLRPKQVLLKGAASPYKKQILSRYIANELGIPEEQQKWN